MVLEKGKERNQGYGQQRIFSLRFFYEVKGGVIECHACIQYSASRALYLKKRDFFARYNTFMMRLDSLSIRGRRIDSLSLPGMRLDSSSMSRWPRSVH
ncbi:hypothetical protein CEXT_530871 [Caerostris extrusa]|uniref:Uncharacterized protein n=1 Tax=Caerostris extrusa TaxID=172846 RepID=A0AAV4S9U5_CAEEX|nr:hypothetical protein CEXT_530871 [Caerostris extrusa]